jgi:hypothetical protein
MQRSFALSTAVIIGSALVLGGCSLFPQTPKPTPSPTPSASPKTNTFSVPDLPSTTTTTTATSSAAPTATASGTTKGGIVKGVTTTTPKTVTVTKTVSNLFDTSFDSWYIINYPGQNYEKELIIYNKSDKPMMYSARAADRVSDTVPVSVNGTFEATGKMLPLSQEIIKLKAVSSDKTPSFTTTVTINFISEQNQILATKTVRITAYTPVGDRLTVNTDTPTSKAGNQTYDVAYRSLAAYPIRIKNRNQRELNFSAKIVNPEAAKVMAFSAKSGVIKSGEWWDTDVHFLKPDTKVDQVTVEFTFTGQDDDPYKATKTITLNIK